MVIFPGAVIGAMDFVQACFLKLTPNHVFVGTKFIKHLRLSPIGQRRGPQADDEALLARLAIRRGLFADFVWR